jgi:hypothetical protein
MFTPEDDPRPETSPDAAPSSSWPSTFALTHFALPHFPYPTQRTSGAAGISPISAASR